MHLVISSRRTPPIKPLQQSGQILSFSQIEFAKRHLKDFQAIWDITLWLDGTLWPKYKALHTEECSTKRHGGGCIMDQQRDP